MRKKKINKKEKINVQEQKKRGPALLKEGGEKKRYKSEEARPNATCQASSVTTPCSPPKK